MITSAIKGKYTAFLNVLIYIYSAFTICFASYVNDLAIKNFDKDQNIKISQLENKLTRASETRNALSMERLDILKASQRYTGLGALSKGNDVLKGRRLELKSSEVSNDKKIVSIEKELKTLNSKRLSKSTFSKENLTLLSYETYAVMGMFLLIQLLSAYFTRSFFTTTSNYINQNKKLKNRRKKKQGLKSTFSALVH